MRSYPVSRSVFGIVLLFCICACSQTGGPKRIDTFSDRTALKAPLPDDVERAAGRVAALSLAGLADRTATAYQKFAEYDESAQAEGKLPTGLADNALDLVYALEGIDVYGESAVKLLEREDVDPVLRRRTENFLDNEPLAIAESRLSQDRARKFASVFNRIIAPISRFLTGGALNPIESGRAALASLLIMRSFPKATTQERQALRAYQDFLLRFPDHPDAPWVRERVIRYEGELKEYLRDEAIDVANLSMKLQQPDAVRSHLDRAERILPGDERVSRLREKADAQIEKRDSAFKESFQATSIIGLPADPSLKKDLHQLATTLLIGSLADANQQARRFETERSPGPLWDELAFIEAMAGDGEERFFEMMEILAIYETDVSNMSRHAAMLVSDPEQNPYKTYRHAVRTDTRQRRMWLMLGSRARGPLDRKLPQALEWIIDIPGFVVAIITTPIRAIQYPNNVQNFGGQVISAGERYLARFPAGIHANEINAKLESLYNDRQHWSQALAHHQALTEPNPKRLASYREQIAKRTLASARLQRRFDVRGALYRSVITEYADTPQAETARDEMKQLFASYSTQSIRLSREFLEENPSLWRSDTLGFRRELFDGDKRNGEIADDGITLLGKTLVRVELKGREPNIAKIPKENFARFISALEEVRYRRIATDTRDQPVPDPARDLFFERAKLGLLDDVDARPTAASGAEYLGRQEEHGVRKQTSILPVELVVQGGLEDFGFSAFPRLKRPADTPDAFLYK